MLFRLLTVYKIIHCVGLHTLCNITQSVLNHTVKWSIFCVTFGKNLHRPKKITRAPPVAPVTNIRYGLQTSLLISFQEDFSEEMVKKQIELAACDINLNINIGQTRPKIGREFILPSKMLYLFVKQRSVYVLNHIRS